MCLSGSAFLTATLSLKHEFINFLFWETESLQSDVKVHDLEQHGGKQ